MRLRATRLTSISGSGSSGGISSITGVSPSLDLRFADNKSLVDSVSGQSLVTFSRASSATYTDSTGTLQTATTNAPRFDHNPITRESLGLLVEEPRTNLLLQSNGFTTNWSTSGSASLTSNAGTAPDGTNSAWELKDTVDSTVTQHLISQSISFTSGTTYILSCWAKRSSLAFVGLALPPGPFGSTLVARFDLSNGSVVTTPSGGTCTITPFSNGWYRCTLSATATATSTQSVAIRTSNSSSSSYQGDGTGTILLWGAQLEAGAFATSYIPTTTAAATRAADVASITGAAFSSWYRQDEGTVFVDFNTAPVANIAQTVFDLSEGAGSERIHQRRTSSGFIGTAMTDNNVIQGDFGSVSVPASGRARSGYAYRLNDLEAAVNGSSSGTDTSATIPTPDRIHIGQNFGSGQFANGTIRRLTYFPARLPNTTLQRLTQ